ncbi:amidohydrolase family protein [Fibrella aquatilis]|uniref:Amidohydrolase family protein n=1 Tax=Fibrella aquatilis TaxID=2817059 RepID=A0A939G6W9_9BACT|nr:amidohydrolase family protein [Fibrella aquatilis]MBO0931739.1 amidohydrolase family protein [Fibrella aquatilis]
MKHITNTIFLCLMLTSAWAQNPAPGLPQQKAIALMGGTIHTGTGQVIPNGYITFDKGVITGVGDASTVRMNTNEVQVIDVAGRHVYPGLISPASLVGLQEVASVRATIDSREVGVLNPNVRALIAYDSDSEIIPTIRNNGILITQAMPVGGTVSGSSSIMHTDGWNWQDAVLRKDDGIWLNWPGYYARDFDFDTFQSTVKKNDKRDEAIRAVQLVFAEAKAYAEGATLAAANLKFEAMRGLFTGKQNLYVRADYAKDIIEAVRFAKAAGVPKVVIVGAEDSDKVAAFLKENNVPVILSPLHRLPNREDEPVDLPYRLPGILQKAGVTVGLSYAEEWWRTRNLPFLAGTAVGFGVTDREEALKMVTANTAKILGIDGQVGTLETGKQATIVVSKGDILDMRTNVIEQAFIQGRQVNLDDKHKRLYNKFKTKYGQK